MANIKTINGKRDILPIYNLYWYFEKPCQSSFGQICWRISANYVQMNLLFFTWNDNYTFNFRERFATNSLCDLARLAKTVMWIYCLLEGHPILQEFANRHQSMQYKFEKRCWLRIGWSWRESNDEYRLFVAEEIEPIPSIRGWGNDADFSCQH